MTAHVLGAPRNPENPTPTRKLIGPSPPGVPRVTSRLAAKSAPEAPFTVVDLGDSFRVAAMLTPRGRGDFEEQLREVLSQLSGILNRQGPNTVVTMQSVFLRSVKDQPACERLLAECFVELQPVTNYVFQAPAGGAAVALEVWAIGGDSVRVERFGSEVLTLAYDSVRWIYCAGLHTCARKGVYQATQDILARMGAALETAGAGFEDVVRTWFYLGGITNADGATQRYKELNRARTDFYEAIPFGSHLGNPKPDAIYPASTGIGIAGGGLLMSCVALQSKREDVVLRALENPRQTPAYSYHEGYSPKSPKFSRAMALKLGDYITTWVSGTASIVKSESCHEGDIEKQTEQTIKNIETLIGTENLAAHGLEGVHSSLQDLAKVRVYIKRPEDYAACRDVCERHFGAVPAIYAVADVCRPELLVEIEGIAFSKCGKTKTSL